jgi:hypothetical protein
MTPMKFDEICLVDRAAAAVYCTYRIGGDGAFRRNRGSLKSNLDALNEAKFYDLVTCQSFRVTFK